MPCDMKKHKRKRIHKRIDQFVRFDSVDDEERIVEGFLSVEMVDRKGTIISTDAIMEAAQEYIDNSHAKLRVQHLAIPIGRVLKIEKRDKELEGRKIPGVWIRAQIDKGYPEADGVWAMVQQKALEGFSIGFDPIADMIWCEKQGECFPKIIRLRWIETSIVDLPANPGAFFENIRSAFSEFTNPVDLATFIETLDAINARPCMNNTFETRSIESETMTGEQPPAAQPPAAQPPAAQPPAAQPPAAQLPAGQQPPSAQPVGTRQEVPPPAAPPPAAEPSDLEKLMAQIEELIARVAKLEEVAGGDGGEVTPPPAAEGAEPAVTKGEEEEEKKKKENEGDVGKQLQAAQKRVEELTAQVKKLEGGETQPRSDAPGATRTAPPAGTLDIPEDMRSLSAEEVEYVFQRQLAAAAKKQ